MTRMFCFHVDSENRTIKKRHITPLNGTSIIGRLGLNGGFRARHILRGGTSRGVLNVHHSDKATIAARYDLGEREGYWFVKVRRRG